jgi:hypothetical protein
MNSAGWLEHIIVGLEREAISDISMLPDTPSALEREWRSFDREGRRWRADRRRLGRAGRLHRAVCRKAGCPRIELAVAPLAADSDQGPTLADLLLLLVCDVVGLAVFAGIFVYSRHWLASVGVAPNLAVLSASG